MARPTLHHDRHASQPLAIAIAVLVALVGGSRCSSAPRSVRTIPAVCGSSAGPVRTVAARSPSSLVVDGSVGEWRELDGEAGEFVAIAVTKTALLLAGRLDSSRGDGLDIRLSAAPAKAPPLGLGDGHGDVEPFDCENEQVRDSEGGWISAHTRRSMAAARECRERLDAHARLEATLAARYVRHLLLRADRVESAAPDGSVTQLAGATIVWARDACSRTFEAELPLSALPRLAEAPLRALGVSIGDAESARLLLSEPVFFEPFGELRARIFAVFAKPTELGYSWGRVSGLSYDPGDPGHVESLRYRAADGDAERSAVMAVVEPLFEPKATSGEISVGVAHALFEWIAVFRRDRLMDLVPLAGEWEPPRRVRGISSREGMIRVVTFGPLSFSMATGEYKLASWAAFAIREDGKLRDLMDDTLDRTLGPGGVDCYPPTLRVQETADEGLDTLGLSGTCAPSRTVPFGGPEAPLKLTEFRIEWRWTEAANSYVGKATVSRRALAKGRRPSPP